MVVKVYSVRGSLELVYAHINIGVIFPRTKRASGKREIDRARNES